VWGEAGIIPFGALMIFVFSTYYQVIFWLRDNSYKFLALSILMVVTVQVFGAAHTGLKNSELLCMLGILLGMIEVMKGKRRSDSVKILRY